MKPNQRIKIGILEGHVTVSVNDYELFDFLDDHLVECGLGYDYHQTRHSNGRDEYVMHFLQHDNLNQIQEVINLIPNEEVERIWRLNN